MRGVEQDKTKETYARELAVGAVLTAVALALSYVERLIPFQLLIPLPGVKLGLANIASMLALYYLSTRTAFTVTVLRCLIGAIFGGGITGLLMSMTGGLLSVLVMALAKKNRGFSIYGVSILGAAAHNIGQVCAAALLMGTWNIFIYLGFLLLVAVVSGICTGAVSAFTLRALSSAGKGSAV